VKSDPKQAEQLRARLAGSHRRAGAAHDKLGRWQDSVKAYEQAARHDPKNAHAHFNLGYAPRRLEHFDAALAAYWRAAGLGSDDAEAHRRLALLHLLKNDRAAAQAQYDRVKSLDPKLASTFERHFARQ
jgi:tetratricopeptide (TPR) repeat protein